MDNSIIKELQIKPTMPACDSVKEKINNLLVSLKYSKDGYSGYGRGYYVVLEPNHKYESGRVFRIGCQHGNFKRVFVSSAKRFSQRTFNELLNEVSEQSFLDKHIHHVISYNQLQLN